MSEHNQKLKVVILATGGTIVSSGASASQVVGYSLGEISVTDLLRAVPDIRDIADIEVSTVCHIPSSHIDSAIWLKLAQATQLALEREDVAGVVITHGTDTLEETAFFLNLVLKSAKPVVLTGAMRPATALSADGPLNLLNATRLAAEPRACGRGVLICLNGAINGARDTTKTNTCSPDAFRSREYGMFGFVLGDIVEFFATSSRPHTEASEFSLYDFHAGRALPRVDILYGHAEDDGTLIRAAVTAGAIGLVQAGVGHGTLPNLVEAALFEARASGVTVVRASRVGAGPVLPSHVRWQDAGIIPCGTLNPQKARILLQLSLNKFGPDQGQIKRCFETY